MARGRDKDQSPQPAAPAATPPSIAQAAAPSPSPRNWLSVLSDGLRICLFYADCAENFKQIFNSRRKTNAAVEPIISICLLAYQT